MKMFSFKLPLYGLTVSLVQIEGKEDADTILPVLKNNKLAQDDIQQTLEEIRRGCFNGGDTYRNFEIERILVIFYLMKSERMRANIYSHEKRHIEDRVLEWAGVNDIEASAFLAGFLGEKFYEFTEFVRKKKG